MTPLRRLLFTLTLLGGLLIILLQMRPAPDTSEPEGAETLRPDAYFSGYRARFYRPTGELQLDISGERATHQSTTRMNQADAPSVSFYDSEQRLWRLKAQFATYPFTGEEVNLHGEVELTQESPDNLERFEHKEPEILLTTRDLVYYPSSREIFTPSLLTLKSAKSEWSAHGIRGDLNSRRFVFLGQVQGIHREN